MRVPDWAKRLAHFVSGVMSGLFLMEYYATGAVEPLVVGLVITLSFHVYEVSQYHMVRDHMYKQLLEHYVGLDGVFLLHLLGLL